MSDVHKHRCKQCGTIWQHDRELIPYVELDKAHDCPKCGDHNSLRYYGEEPVDVVQEFPEIVGIVGSPEPMVAVRIVDDFDDCLTVESEETR